MGKKTKNIFNKVSKALVNNLSLIVFVLITVAISSVTAEPPASKYTPGESIDPNCAQGDANCTVTAPANSGANTDIDSITGSGALTFTSGTDTNLTLIPGGSGKVILDALNWPTSDGSNNHVLKTDGSGNLAFSAITTIVPAFKSYNFTSQGIGAGTYYVGGFYEAPSADANLDQGGFVVPYGTDNKSYAAHAFLVAGGAGTATGGSGAVTIVVRGTSITDAGVRTTSDTETIVSDITAMSTDTYYETSKKWLGTITYTLTVGATGHTAYAADFNYGLAKYEDFGNKDFTITDFEAVGLAAGNDTGFNVQLCPHVSTGWTYSAAAFAPGTAELVGMNTDHSTEQDITTGEHFAYKRAGLSQAIEGSASEGLLMRVTIGVNNSIEYMSIHVGITI